MEAGPAGWPFRARHRAEHDIRRPPRDGGWPSNPGTPAAGPRRVPLAHVARRFSLHHPVHRRQPRHVGAAGDGDDPEGPAMSAESDRSGAGAGAGPGRSPGALPPGRSAPERAGSCAASSPPSRSLVTSSASPTWRSPSPPGWSLPSTSAASSPSPSSTTRRRRRAGICRDRQRRLRRGRSGPWRTLSRANW